MSAWPLKRLDAVANVGAGNPAPQNKSLFEDGTHPFFRTSDVGRIHTGVLLVSQDKLNERGIKGLKLQKAGTVLLPKSGASTFTDHRVIMGVDGYVSSHLATIVAKEREALGKWLYYALLSVRARDVAPEAGYPTLSLAQIKAIEIPMPEPAEQERLVAVLDKSAEIIGRARSLMKEKLKTIDELEGAILRDALNGEV